MRQLWVFPDHNTVMAVSSRVSWAELPDIMVVSPGAFLGGNQFDVIHIFFDPKFPPRNVMFSYPEYEEWFNCCVCTCLSRHGLITVNGEIHRGNG